MISYLPLSHIAAQMMVSIYVGVGVVVYHAVVLLFIMCCLPRCFVVYIYHLSPGHQYPSTLCTDCAFCQTRRSEGNTS